MSSSEINGLRNIINSWGTVHSLEMPPEDCTPEEYDAWWVRMHCWRVEVRDVDENAA